MFEFLKIKKEFKKTKNYINLINKNFLNLNNFNLFLINEKIKDCQKIFIEYFIYLSDIKNNNHNLIDNSYLLFNELKNKSDFKTKEFIKEKYNDDNLLNAKNILILNEPTYANKISLNIKNYYIDKVNNFKIIIEGIDEDKNFYKIIKDIFPINYGGKYIEKLILNQDYKSKFQTQNEIIEFYDQNDNKKLEIKYNIDDSGYININKDSFFNDNIIINYNPNIENFYIDCNFYISKVYLNTDFENNNIKKINFIKEENYV